MVKSGRVSVPVSQEAKPDIVDPDIDTPEGYRLIWQDEFNDSKLSTPEYESLWWYETGASGWGNTDGYAELHSWFEEWRNLCSGK